MDALIEDFLQGCSLRIGSELTQVVELEAYQSPDPYIHRLPEQSLFGHWYFHRSSSSQEMCPHGFKGGNYKGLDFTAGMTDPSGNKLLGGILIRSILTPSGLVEGPSKVVDYILEQTGCANILELVSLSPTYPPRCDDPNFPLHLVASDRRSDLIYSGPRVGLTYRSDPDSQQYFRANLRFTTYPTLHKNKFSFVLNYLCSDSSTELTNQKINAAAKIFNTNVWAIIRWWTDFKQGKCSHQVIEGSTVPELCKLYGFLWNSN